MEDEEIKALLDLEKTTGERSWNCPNEGQLAAYIGKRLNTSTRTAIETHASDCDYCLSQLAFLAQAPDSNVEDVPATLLLPARELVKQNRSAASGWGWRWVAAPLAIASLVLLAIGLGIQLRRQQTAAPEQERFVATKIEPSPIVSPPLGYVPHAEQSKPPPVTPSPKPGSAIVRGPVLNGFVPALAYPREGQSIPRESLEFRWQPVADAIFYEVRLLSASGDVVFSARTEEARIRPGPGVSLVPETKYFAMVTAHLREGKTTKSSVVGFRLTTQ